MDTPFIDFVMENRFLQSGDGFLLVDVGARGGIHPQWLVFGDLLRSVGFDPLVKECARLNNEAQNDNIKYVPAYIVSDQTISSPPNAQSHMKTNTVLERLSCIQANERLGMQPAELHNSFEGLIYSDERITLDDYFSQYARKIDFIKIDTDGDDFLVLQGAERLFKEQSFLGICIEAQFHGELGEHANTFSNIDRFLRDRGFSLFDLHTYRYSRRDLPGKFLMNIPSHTDIGQIQWGDALYFRDLGNTAYADNWGYTISTMDVVKLICLYEMHGLNDCAVELIHVHNAVLRELFDVDYATSLLVPPINGKKATVQDYEDRFNRSILEMQYKHNGNMKQWPQRKREQFRKCKDIILFGAGGRLQAAYSDIREYFDAGVSIRIVDNDDSKWGKVFIEHEIMQPNTIIEHVPDMVIIVSHFQSEIWEQLCRLIQESNIEFHIVYY